MKHMQLLSALLCAITAFAHAETNNMLDEVVVTATRVAQPLKQTLSNTTVINQQDILNSQAVDVPTLLRQLAGVEIYQSGGIGAQSSLFMRGSNSNHTLVLVDGARINSATTGATVIDQLMLDQVERIEVVRGNASSLYGSEAIGGVIQIYTKRGKGAPAFNASAGGGTHNVRRYSAGYGGETQTGSFNMKISRYSTDGISAINPAIAPNANPDDNGYKNTSYSANGRFATDDKHVLTASIFSSDADISYDSAWATPLDVHLSRSKLSKVGVGLESALPGNWNSNLQWSRGADSLENYLNGQPDTMAGALVKSSNEQISWQNTQIVNEQNYWQFGVERLTQKVQSDTVYAQTNRRAEALFGGYTARTATQQLQFNLRQDRYSDFGNANTTMLGYGIDLSQSWRVSANSGSGYKAPTFNDMYSPWGGNPNLKPERSHNTEFGLHYATAEQRLDYTNFNNSIEDLIAADNTWTMKNLKSARINGWELAYSGVFGATTFSAALTQQTPRDEQTGLLLLRRARKYANLGLTQQGGDFRWGAEWKYSGERDDYDINTSARTILPSYNLVSLTAHYALDKQLNLSMRVDNLFNRDYSLAHGYNTLGRTLFVGVSYQ